MKTIIKILKWTTFGLFKIHLWLPVLYTAIFFTITVSAGFEGVLLGYAIGLVATLLGSVALTYYFSARKLNKGKYSDNKKIAKKEGKRLLVAPPEQPAARTAPPQGYAPMPPEPQPMYRQPAYDPHTDLYPQGYASQPQRSVRETGYDPRAELYENNYGNGRIRGHETGYDPRTELYGANPPLNADRPTFTGARQSLYANDIPAGSHPGRADAAMALYPTQEPMRDELERRDASRALYPEHKQADFDRYNHSSASDTLYPQQPPSHFGGYDRPAGGALYTNKQQPEYNTFSPYIQPVNSMLPKRDGQPALYGEPPPAPAHDEAAKSVRDVNTSTPADFAPSKISRRREVPLQIYATKADGNTYVYEYADRFEFIKLLDDGNKQLIKTEFKSE